LYEVLAASAGTFVPAKVVAIALNTANLPEAEAHQAIANVQVETGLPCTDPVRFGADLLLDVILENS
jgi:uncharacterized NAD-dependent epimerase/dehydratase family protein